LKFFGVSEKLYGVDPSVPADGDGDFFAQVEKPEMAGEMDGYMGKCTG